MNSTFRRMFDKLTLMKKGRKDENMKTDIQIAQEAEMSHIRDVAASIGIEEDDLELYGKYKAKLSDDLWE